MEGSAARAPKLLLRLAFEGSCGKMGVTGIRGLRNKSAWKHLNWALQWGWSVRSSASSSVDQSCVAVELRTQSACHVCYVKTLITLTSSFPSFIFPSALLLSVILVGNAAADSARVIAIKAHG